MSRGTAHNLYNRIRQNAHEESELRRYLAPFKREKLERRRKANEAAELKRKAKEAAEMKRKVREEDERRKGRLEVCGICRELFRSTSPEVGIYMCPSCRSKARPR